MLAALQGTVSLRMFDAREDAPARIWPFCGRGYFTMTSTREGIGTKRISSSQLKARLDLSFVARFVALDLPEAGVAELADALDSKSSDRKIVWVRAPPPASSFDVGRSTFRGTNRCAAQNDR